MASVKSGTPTAQTSKASSKIDSYVILGGVFVLTLIIILLVLSSNRKTLNAKLEKVRNRSATSMEASAQQPPMEVMQKIQGLKDAYQQNPHDLSTLVNLGNSYFDINRFNQAVFYYRKAIALKGDQPDVLIDLGISYFNLQHGDSAIYFVKKALEFSPNHLTGMYNLGIIYYNLKQKDKAIQTWQELIKKSPESREAQAAKQFINQIKDKINKS